MIQLDNEQFIQQFQVNYERVFNYIGPGTDPKLLMSLASRYTLKEKQFSGVVLRKVMEVMEEEGTFPFQIESPMSYKLAMYLLEGSDIHNAISYLNQSDNILNEVGFRQTNFRVIGALFLRGDRARHAVRAKQLFDKMNRLQRFLTSKEDIPYAVLLTSNSTGNDAELRANTMHRYYGKLRKQHFRRGNYLQALTQIMTLYSVDYSNTLMLYIVQLRAELLKMGISVKRNHYPFIGILALAATNDSRIDEISELNQLLCEQKAFRSAKEFALIVAIQKIINDLVEVKDVVDLSSLSHLTNLLDIADFIFDFGWFFPSGVSDLLDFLN